MNTLLSQEFISELSKTLGETQAHNLIAALDTAPVVGVRINHSKAIADTELEGETVSWCKQGKVLAHRPQFTLMPAWHAGCFYVQEPASMIIGEVISRLLPVMDKSDVRYLDACAAPGGKTTTALGVLPPDAFVVANEFVPSRANILVENLTKWGSPKVAVTCGDTSVFRKLSQMFDIVAVDAPCSGEGMMRKDEEARRQWSPGLVKQCATLQREIVSNAWEALRPGGFMIYSTCTFNHTENEDMLRFLTEELGALPHDTGICKDFGIPSSLDADLPAMRFMPHLTCGEGLFIGVVRKPGVCLNQPSKKIKEKKGKLTKIPEAITRMVADGSNYEFTLEADNVWHAIPTNHISLVKELRKHSRLLSCGIAVASEKGKNLVPEPALALSTALAPEVFPRVETDLNTALNYLRREAITLPSDTPHGYVIICFQGHPLGFAKNLGNRANNMYPQAWRIRHL